jgi:hypothetical protein
MVLIFVGTGVFLPGGPARVGVVGVGVILFGACVVVRVVVVEVVVVEVVELVARGVAERRVTFFSKKCKN